MISKIPQRFKSSQGLAYIKVGTGPSLVLIHGVGLRLDAWIHQIEDLAQQFTVYAVDMPGHGDSDLFPECRNIDQYTDVIASWVTSDVETPVVMVGHSMGSMIALNFAMRYSDSCVGVVALNSIFRRSEEAKKAVLKRVSQIKESLSTDDVTAPVKRWFDFPLSSADTENIKLCSEWLSKASLKGYQQAYEVFCFNDGPSNNALSSLTIPALFMTGSGDANSTPKMSEAMADLCPKGSRYIVEHARHMLTLTHHKEINTIIKAFGQHCFDPIEEVSYEYI